ncbi:MAG: LuxR C-terminal-related transcriptional regulator [Rhizobiaceae bacterium]
MLAKGKSTTEIASKLSLSDLTVLHVINSARAKLGAKSHCHAIAASTSVGFIDNRGR